MGEIAARLALGLMWLVHFLPLALLAKVGIGLGALAYWVVPERRRVCRINLAQCFPHMSAPEREALVRRHFHLFGRFVLEHGIMWWASKTRFVETVRVENPEVLESLRGRPVVLLAPHFLGLDMGGVRLSCELPMISMYQKQKIAKFDEQIRAGRLRFCGQFPESGLFSRQDGVRAIARAMRRGVALYYLPDLDFGPRETIFVPFFGLPAATITGVSRLARLAGATVVPCVTIMLPGGAGYRVRLYPAWKDFPTEDVAADARRMNAFIEDRVREAPEQYYWLHKRFKTRPKGAPPLY